MRNAEEVKGHLESSITLKGDDPDGASLHAGHPTDYLESLGAATYNADRSTYEGLREVSYGTGDMVGEESAGGYESYVRDEAFPAIDSAVEAAVPSEYRTTETRAQVAADLTDRLMEEYSAAITEEGETELEGEYWDGRGFLVRITEIHETELSGEMSDESDEELTTSLDSLRSSYEDEVPPSEIESDVENVRNSLESADFSTGQQETETASESGDSNSDSGSESGDREDGQGLPGFTAVAFLVAVVVSAFVVRGR